MGQADVQPLLIMPERHEMISVVTGRCRVRELGSACLDGRLPRLAPAGLVGVRSGVPADALACAVVTEEAVDETLASYRSSIDNIDAALILLLAERFKITKQVGLHKARAGLPAADPERERQHIARLRELAASANLDPSFSEKLLRFVISEVVRHHELVRGYDSAPEHRTKDK